VAWHESCYYLLSMPLVTPESKPALLGLAAGISLGLFDYLAILFMGLRMQVGDWDVTELTSLIFAVSYGVLGFVIGRLFATRRALAATELRAAENARLAVIGRLSAGVAHEVRNPLGVIRSAASMLLEGLDPEDERFKAGEFICCEVDRLNRFVTSLLDFSRPLTPRQESVDLAWLVDTLRPEGATCSGSGVVTGDPDMLTQVVRGLLTNAAEARGGGSLKLRIERLGNEVQLDVADDGPGIPTAQATQVFEPFFTTKPTGSGLGLAVAARIIEAHGGRIAAIAGAGAAADGSGACIRLWLPAAEAPGA